jgi:hypothetical protein
MCDVPMLDRFRVLGQSLKYHLDAVVLDDRDNVLVLLSKRCLQ